MCRVSYAPVFFLLLLGLSGPVRAQFLDDFSDGDLTVNPSWSGDLDNFRIISGRLQLDAPPVDAASYLSTPSDVINDAEWTIDVELDFLTSRTSLTRIYIVSDHEDLAGPLNGYFVEIGNTDDHISLFKQIGTEVVPIIQGIEKSIDSNPVSVRVRVTRDIDGNWSLFRDIDLTGSYYKEGDTTDLEFTRSSWYGIYCEYIGSRSDKFFFDNISVTGMGYIDRDPPLIDSLAVNSSSRLVVYFNEPVETTTASDPKNYLVNNNLGHPQYASVGEDSTTVDLLFTGELPNGMKSKLTVNGVKDIAGNQMEPVTLPFLYFHANPINTKDVILTEILADPVPPVSLPEEEYVELFNRSQNPVDLGGWILTDGHSDGMLPDTIMLPGTYWIITSNSVVDAFQAYDHVLGVDHFPGLNNDGDQLTLLDKNKTKIDEVNYDKSWYHDDDKAEGGWSLELIDPENICAANTNWTASVSSTGGTPGTLNSVFDIRPDRVGPGLLHAIPLSRTQVHFQFDERLNARLPAKEDFHFAPPTAIRAVAFADSMQSLDVSCDALTPGQLYQVTLSAIRDCPGNLIRDDANVVSFGLPENADVGDVVINEILFNPTPTGVDFVELYNASPKFINLKGWLIGNWSDSLSTNRKLITGDDRLLAPGAYVAVTSDATILTSEYINAPSESVWQVASLPSFPDDHGSVALIDSGGHSIDHFVYSDAMHSPFLNETEGVSLERLDPSAPTQDESNWKSAASQVGYATPGYMNSNTVTDMVPDATVEVDPQIFRPESGVPDHTVIRYRMDHAGYIGNVTIHSLQGSLVKTLAENALLGTRGFFRWDGDDESGNRAAMGYYYMMFDAFDGKGKQVSVIKRVVVAAQL